MNNTILNIKEDSLKRIEIVSKKLEEGLEKEGISKVLYKMKEMDHSFFYSIFYPYLSGFNSLENLEHTMNVLYQALFDDIGLFLNKVPIRKDVYDSINKIRIKKNQEPLTYIYETKINDDENGIWVNEEILLNYINEKEKREIKKINAINQQRKLSHDEKERIYERIKNFNDENKKDLLI